MKITRRRELIVTRERHVTVRFGSCFTEEFCAVCNGKVQSLTIDEAVLLANVSRQAILHLIASSRLHSVEMPHRVLRICLQSLITLSTENTEEK